MANLTRVMGDPLSDRNIKLVVTELDETAVAVSVVGTSVRRLRDLGTLAEVIAQALSGDRPEVKKLRTRLLQLVQNLKISGTKNYQATRPMRALARGVQEAGALLKRGIGNAPPEYDAGDFVVRNTWGYGKSEARPALRELEKVSRKLGLVGLGTAVSTIELWGTGSGPEFVQDLQAVVIDPGKSLTTDELLKTLGRRLWDDEFRANDYETWGGKGGVDRFAALFSKAVAGKSIDVDPAARLQLTVGKLAARWPELA